MGSPLGTSLANIIMEYLQSKFADELLPQVLYVRYRDNCQVVLQIKKVNETLFFKLNALHKSFFFTKEVEIHNQINFLDKLITESKEIFFYKFVLDFMLNICVTILFV